MASYLHFVLNLIITLSLFFIIPFTTAAPLNLKQAPYKKAVRTGTITDPNILEASGIAASTGRQSTLWVINDGGNPAVLYALAPTGKRLNSFLIVSPSGMEVKNTDWEDLSAFEYNGEHFLLIADLGDNKAKRNFCTLLVIKEPDPESHQKKLPIECKIQFKYADGPNDCEAVAVDVPKQRILLLSKRKPEPILYELPLIVSPGRDMYTAHQIGIIKNIPEPTPSDLKDKYGAFRSQPTAMDLSSDGRTMVILTYKHGYIYNRQSGQTWQDAFTAMPLLLELPHPNTGELVQREALCLDQKTGAIIVTSEKANAPIYVLNPMK